MVDAMRRLWLTFLTVFALAASGLASAMAAEACPMLQAAAAEGQHDCCPDEGGAPQNQPNQQHDMDGCMMGMACRTAPAVAPSLAPIALTDTAILLSGAVTRQPAELSGPLQQLFRPPRSV